jgi:hypothetical protein
VNCVSPNCHIANLTYPAIDAADGLVQSNGNQGNSDDPIYS